MHIARPGDLGRLLEDLRLERLDVVHGGPHSFLLAPRIRAVAFPRLLHDLAPLA
jgi:hypothetical protein